MSFLKKIIKTSLFLLCVIWAPSLYAMEEKPKINETKKHLFLVLVDKTQNCIFSNMGNICDIFKKFYPEDRNIILPKLITQGPKYTYNRLWDPENLATCLELCEQLYIYKKDGFLVTVITHGIGIEYISLISQLLSENMQAQATFFSEKAEPGFNTFNVHFLDTKIYLKSFAKYLNFNISQKPIIDHVYTFNALDNDAFIHFEMDAIGQHIHFSSTDFYWKNILGGTPKTISKFNHIGSVSSGVKPPSSTNKEEVESLFSFFLPSDSDIKPENKLFTQTAVTALFLNLPVIGNNFTNTSKTFDIILSPAKYKQTPEIINKNKEKMLKKGLNDKKRDFIIITDPQSPLYPHRIKLALSLQVTHINDSTSIQITDNDKNKPENSNFWNVQNLKKAKEVCMSILESKKLDNSVTIIADGAGIWISALASQLLSFDNEMDLAFTQTDLIDAVSYQQETKLFKNQFSKTRKEIQKLKQVCSLKKNKPFIDVIYSCNTINCSFFFYIDPVSIGQHVTLFSTNPTWQTILGSKKGASIALNTVFCNVQPPREQAVTTSSYTSTPKEFTAMVYAIGTKITTLEDFFPLGKNIVALWPTDEKESIKIIDN